MSFSKPIENRPPKDDVTERWNFSASATDQSSSGRSERENEEIAALKDLVKSLELKCHSLISLVEDMERGSPPPADVAAMMTRDFNLLSSECTTNTYRREHEEMKNQIRELVDKNLKWQEFGSKRDTVIEVQSKQIKDLRDEIERLKQCPPMTSQPVVTSQSVTSSGMSSKLAASRQIEIDNLFLQQKAKSAALEDEKNLLLDEIHKLKRLNQELQQRLEEAESYKLSAASTRSEGITTEMERALKEENELLQMQLIIHRDDFESERHDRERAQQRVAELQQQIQVLLNKEAYQIQSHSKNSISSGHGYPSNSIYAGGCNAASSSLSRNHYQVSTFPAGIPSQGRYGYDGHDASDHPGSKYRNDCDGLDQSDCVDVLRARGKDDSVYQTDYHDDDTEIDSVRGQTDIAGSKTISADSQRDSVLSCPRCLKSFSLDDHVNLIEHMEECV